MTATISIGRIIVGSATNCVGVFNGQNMQNDWDSHAPVTTCIGALTGNHSQSHSVLAYVWTHSVIGQATLDQDWKCNGSPMLIGP